MPRNNKKSGRAASSNSSTSISSASESESTTVPQAPIRRRNKKPRKEVNRGRALRWKVLVDTYKYNPNNGQSSSHLVCTRQRYVRAPRVPVFVNSNCYGNARNRALRSSTPHFDFDEPRFLICFLQLLLESIMHPEEPNERRIFPVNSNVRGNRRGRRNNKKRATATGLNDGRGDRSCSHQATGSLVGSSVESFDDSSVEGIQPGCFHNNQQSSANEAPIFLLENDVDDEPKLTETEIANMFLDSDIESMYSTDDEDEQEEERNEH